MSHGYGGAWLCPKGVECMLATVIAIRLTAGRPVTPRDSSAPLPSTRTRKFRSRCARGAAAARSSARRSISPPPPPTSDRAPAPPLRKIIMQLPGRPARNAPLRGSTASTQPVHTQVRSNSHAVHHDGLAASVLISPAVLG
ncbi:unnamed protein product, partial [Iphiclides podalirius]